jgi:hypothetical protein
VDTLQTTPDGTGGFDIIGDVTTTTPSTSPEPLPVIFGDPHFLPASADEPAKLPPAFRRQPS